MTAKEELHKLVDGLDDIDAAEMLAQMRWLLSDGDALSDETLDEVRRGEDEIAGGGYVALSELKQPITA